MVRGRRGGTFSRGYLFYIMALGMGANIGEGAYWSVGT